MSDESEILFELTCDDKNTHWFHGVKMVTPGSELRQDELNALYLRMFSHILVDHIADKGMAETCESLGDLYEYYTPKAPVHAIDVQSNVIRRILPLVEERPFRISED